jgi:tetratricopeptide (TPR) repeat protein
MWLLGNAKNKSNKKSLLKKANKYFEEGKYEKAMESYDKLIELDPQSFYAWSNKGFIYSLTKKDDDALKCFDKALEIDSYNADVWFLRGLVLSKIKKPDEALESFDKALDLNPEFEKAKESKKLLKACYRMP